MKQGATYMNSTIELIENGFDYWPEFVFGFGTDIEFEGEDDNE